MKAHILNNEVINIYDDNFLDKYSDTLIGCELIDITTEQLIFINSLNKKMYDGTEFYEGLTAQQLNEQKIQQAILIDFEYTNKISELLRKPIEKLNCDGTPIPQEKIDERDALRLECNNKILALGITDFTYRKSVKGL